MARPSRSGMGARTGCPPCSSDPSPPPSAKPPTTSGPSSSTAWRPCNDCWRRRRLRMEQALDHELQAKGEALIGVAGGQVLEHRDHGRELVRRERAELPMDLFAGFV